MACVRAAAAAAGWAGARKRRAGQNGGAGGSGGFDDGGVGTAQLSVSSCGAFRCGGAEGSGVG